VRRSQSDEGPVSGSTQRNGRAGGEAVIGGDGETQRFFSEDERFQAIVGGLSCLATPMSSRPFDYQAITHGPVS
jgi:hypothetical protein